MVKALDINDFIRWIGTNDIRVEVKEFYDALDEMEAKDFIYPNEDGIYKLTETGKKLFDRTCIA